MSGITRNFILAKMAVGDLNHNESYISLDSSTKEILPVTQLDNKPVGNGEPGPIWKDMLARYQQHKQLLRTGDAH